MDLTINKLYDLYLVEKDDYIFSCIYYQSLKLGYKIKQKLDGNGVVLYLSNEDIESICGIVLLKAIEGYKGGATKFVTYLYASIKNKIINDNDKATTFKTYNELSYDDSVIDDFYNDSYFNDELSSELNDNINKTVKSERTKDIMRLIASGHDMVETGAKLGITKQYVNKALKSQKNNKELYYSLKIK